MVWKVASQFVGVPMSGVASLHASLLEHAGALRSGGSLTTVSIVDTENEDLSEPTVDAVVSLVDVLLPFDAKVANAGTAPALDIDGAIGTVGSASYQAAPLRRLAGCLRQTLRDTADDALRADVLVDRTWPPTLSQCSPRLHTHTRARARARRACYDKPPAQGSLPRPCLRSRVRAHLCVVLACMDSLPPALSLSLPVCLSPPTCVILL